jgi:hypothetical protein
LGPSGGEKTIMMVGHIPKNHATVAVTFLSSNSLHALAHESPLILKSRNCFAALHRGWWKSSCGAKENAANTKI